MWCHMTRAVDRRKLSLLCHPLSSFFSACCLTACLCTCWFYSTSTLDFLPDGLKTLPGRTGAILIIQLIKRKGIIFHLRRFWFRPKLCFLLLPHPSLVLVLFLVVMMAICPLLLLLMSTSASASAPYHPTNPYPSPHITWIIYLSCPTVSFLGHHGNKASLISRISQYNLNTTPSSFWPLLTPRLRQLWFPFSSHPLRFDPE